jgi:hypothetical protein
VTEKCPHEELKEIFRQALRAKSAKERLRLRRKGLRKMAAAPEKCFWLGMPPKYRHDPLYIEAAQNAWVDITCKIYGTSKRADIYDPDKGNASPITVWNNRCEGAYLDLLRNQQKEQKLINPNPIDSRTGEPLNIDDVADDVAASEDDKTSWLYQVREIIQQDAEGKYSNNFVRKKPPPPITAQAALLEICDRTSRGEKWTNKILAEHFNISPGTMYAAWTRQLKPLLQKMGDRLGNEI